MQHRFLMEHQRVLLCSERLELLLDEIEQVSIAAIVDARWSFARHTLSHLDSVEMHAFPLLMADPEAVEIARAFAAERDAVAAGFQEHARRYWTDAAIEADRLGYAASLRPNLAALRALFEREERLLYPLLGAAPVQIRPGGASGRWMAEAWRYRSTAPAPR